MTLVLYERLCADDRRPSPYCWRSRLALAHKGLTPELRAIKFTEAEQIAFSGQGKVPVLVDGETVVSDSWRIACYLEEAYRDAPSLFQGAGGQALARFLNHWVDSVLQRALSPILAPAMLEIAHPDDRAYYRETREAKYGRPLSELRGERTGHLAALQPMLEPLRLRLAESDFVGGAAPAYGDYLVFAEFQWARCADPLDLLAGDDNGPIRAWRSRMLALFDGLARRVPAFETAA